MSLLVIRDVRVFDGVSERAIERASVVVEGTRIREVVVGAAAPPRDARVLDGRGGTLLPGFVDMHSHLVSELGARLYLANGVTTVRFAGNDPDAVLALREAIETAHAPGPRIFSLGPLLDGVSPDYPAMSWPLYSAAEARLAVQRLKADYRVDGIILTQKPALEVARAAVDEAHRLGIGATGQTWSLTAREAVALGYDGLENTSRLPEAPRALPEVALLRYRTIPERSAMLALLWARADGSRLERLGHQMVKNETYLVPTLAGMDAILGRYTARIRRDGDTRRLPSEPGRTSAAGSASASSEPPGHRATSPPGRAGSRATSVSSATTRGWAGASSSGPTRSSPAAVSSSTRSSSGSRHAGCRPPPCCGPRPRPPRTRLADPIWAASRRAPRPISSSSPATLSVVWPTPGPSGPSSCAGESSSPTPCSPVPERKPREEAPMTMLRVLGVLLLAAMAALPVGPAAAQDVVIGVAAPMTGNLAQIGKQFAEGAQLAADEVNAKGGIKGKKVVIRVEDDKGDPKDAATVAQKFASDDAVLAVLGHYSSSACFAAIPIYTKARLATITPSASHTDLTKQGGKYMFRMWSPISVYVPDLAQYTVKKLGKKNIGVVYVQNDWGIQTKDYFVKEVEKLGARVAALEVVYDKDTDFKAQLTKVKAANPDALAILTYYTTGALRDAPGAEPGHHGAAGRHRHALRGQVHRARRQGQRRGARGQHRVQRRRPRARRQELRRDVPEAPPEREARAVPRDHVRRRAASSSARSRRPAPTATPSGTPSRARRRSPASPARSRSTTSESARRRTRSTSW